MDRQGKNDDTISLSGTALGMGLATLLSTPLAGVLTDMGESITGAQADAALRSLLGMSLFLGLTLADPLGAVLERQTLRRVVLRFCIGASLGGAVYNEFITPIAAGSGVLRAFLFLPLLLIPALYATTLIDCDDVGRKCGLIEQCRRALSEFLDLAGPLVLLLAYAISAGAYWLIHPETMATGVIVLLLLGAMIVQVLICQTPEDVDADEDPAPSTSLRQAFGRFFMILIDVIPGAMFMIGLVTLTMQILLPIVPDLHAVVIAPAATLLQLAGSILIGVLLIPGGMFGSVLLGTLAIVRIARERGWGDVEILRRRQKLVMMLFGGEISQRVQRAFTAEADFCK